MTLPLSTLKDIATIVQSVITVAAVILGGIWTYWLFVRKREKYPSAKIEHRISHRPIANGKILLSIDATVINSGDVLLALVSGNITVSQMLPPQDELLDILNTSEGDWVTSWHPLVPIVNPIGQKGQLEIEPGESQQFFNHFVIDASIQTILVKTFFDNVEKPKRKIGWTLTTMYDLWPSLPKEQIHLILDQ